MVLDAVKVWMERKLLVKKELAKWKRETQVDLRNWEHRQNYDLEAFRLNCLHGVLPASGFDNPDSGLRSTRLEDLNKPTVVSNRASVKDENTNIDHQLEKMLKGVEAMKKAPVEDGDINTGRTAPSTEELEQMIKALE